MRAAAVSGACARSCSSGRCRLHKGASPPKARSGGARATGIGSPTTCTRTRPKPHAAAPVLGVRRILAGGVPWTNRSKRSRSTPVGGAKPGSARRRRQHADARRRSRPRSSTVTSLPTSGQVLARAGISYVVARNDLDWQRRSAPAGGGRRSAARRRPASGRGLRSRRPQRARCRRARAAGRAGPGPFARGLRRARSASPVATYPQADTVVLDGGPQSLVQLAGLPGWVAGERSSPPTCRRRIARRAICGWCPTRRGGPPRTSASSNPTTPTRSPPANGPGGQASGLQVVPPAPGAGRRPPSIGGGIAGVTRLVLRVLAAAASGTGARQRLRRRPRDRLGGRRRASSQGQWVQANLAHAGARLAASACACSRMGPGDRSSARSR